MPLLFGGILNRNAFVRIESVTVTQDSEGGTSEAYATLTDDVSVLVSQVSASRIDGLGGEHNKIDATITGADSGMARVDVRYFVKTTSLYGLTGVYLYPESASVHGASGEGIMAAEPFYRVKVSSVRTT